MFAHNVGAFDRTIRIVLGFGVLGLFFAYPDTSWRYLALLGAIPVVTGLFGTCPLYSLIGMSTCPVNAGSTPGKRNA